MSIMGNRNKYKMLFKWPKSKSRSRLMSSHLCHACLFTCMWFIWSLYTMGYNRVPESHMCSEWFLAVRLFLAGRVVSDLVSEDNRDLLGNCTSFCFVAIDYRCDSGSKQTPLAGGRWWQRLDRSPVVVDSAFVYCRRHYPVPVRLSRHHLPIVFTIRETFSKPNMLVPGCVEGLEISPTIIVNYINKSYQLI